ncbi:MAG: type II secretion system F family protein [Humibacillus sp.]|nr:type II secretion system F family protein [Humibacillus sp.]MDN5779332.1 type II secretion system F family protein [Humibacillus sp.]
MSSTLAAGLVATLVAVVVLLLPGRMGDGTLEGTPPQVHEAGAGRPVPGRDSPGSLDRPDDSARRMLVPWRRRRGSPFTVGLRTAPSAEAVASALALLALAFRSGLPTWQVLDAVADQSPEPVSRDLRQVAAALRWGADEHEAWASVDSAWAPAARAVSIAHRAGIAPAALLMKAAEDTRRADLERLELAAAQVGVRLVLPLGLVLLPAFCLTTVVPLVVSLGRQLLTTG